MDKLPSFNEDRVRYYGGGSEAQLDWIDNQRHADPHWASHEMEVRRLAFEVQQKLHASASRESVVVPMTRYDGHFSYTTIHFAITRLGGLDELMLIEECIRRAQRGEEF